MHFLHNNSLYLSLICSLLESELTIALIVQDEWADLAAIM